MNGLTDSEQLVALAGAMIVILAAVVQGFLWFWNVTPKPDPWGPEIEEALQDPEVRPVCHHCSAPHSETDWFCSECGVAVGDYNNWNPYLYIFSLGEVLREGTFGKIQRPWLTIPGYLILSAAQYACFAPIYWALLFMNLAGSPLQSHTSTGPTVPPPLPPETV